jgi:hypothetical protein
MESVRSSRPREGRKFPDVSESTSASRPGDFERARRWLEFSSAGGLVLDSVTEESDEESESEDDEGSDSFMEFLEDCASKDCESSSLVCMEEASSENFWSWEL